MADMRTDSVSTLDTVVPPDNPKAATAATGLTAISAAAYLQDRNSYRDPFQKDSLRFAVQDGRLSIPTSSGPVIFTDNAGVPHDENEKYHRYLGLLKPAGKHLVSLQEYEEHAILLIDKRSGIIDTIAGIPLLSPDNRHIFTSQLNGYETYPDLPPPTEDLELWSIGSSGKLQPVWSKPCKWIMKEAYWRNNRSVNIKAEKEENGTPLYWQLNF
ncbi:hypothetical protein C7T94_05265 [Pedobacter yulinensis]|uniref:Uncharacterized protein n=2 Tax=Pedobacter yulinensis TaxID=2126353 RepID=A0A2T3HNX9_9SPHI|nr:hypothetical protein C7T94_05265 [Pedobacter yulinensis]